MKKLILKQFRVILLSLDIVYGRIYLHVYQLELISLIIFELPCKHNFWRGWHFNTEQQLKTIFDPWSSSLENMQRVHCDHDMIL